MEKKYVTVKVNYEYQKEANARKISVNQYIELLRNLVDKNEPLEMESVLKRLSSFEKIAKDQTEAIGYQRYMIDTQTKNQNKKIDSLIDTQEKLIAAYAADIEFIKELKKLVLKGD